MSGDEGNSQETEENNDLMKSLAWTMLLPTRISKPKPGCRRRRGDHKASKAVNGTFKEPKPSLLTAWQGAPTKTLRRSVRWILQRPFAFISRRPKRLILGSFQQECEPLRMEMEPNELIIEGEFVSKDTMLNQ